MANLKTTGITSEPAVSTEKELPFTRQSIEIQNGKALVQEISAAMIEEREHTQSSDENTKQEKSGDTAQLSETRRQFRTDGTIAADEILKWILEMGEDWESFLKWKPNLDMDLQKQLEELSKLYLSLLEAALKYAQGENLTIQMERLDSLLAEKLNLVMEQNLEELISLLEETEQTEALDGIRSSLYRQTAGRTISLRSAHILFAHGGELSRRSAGLFSASSSGEGMIYQSSGKQNIQFQQALHTQQNSWKEQLRQRTETITNARKGIMENTFKQGSSMSCSARELKMANGFAIHIQGKGNLFKNPGISARNEEITGLLAAVMSIKGQVYSAENPRTGSIAFSLQNAVEKLVDQYLRQKGASKVYYHTLAVYKQTKNPQKAIEDGQNYACRQFREKQKDPAYQNSPGYSKDSGFFRAFLKGLSPEKEFALGVDILQKDWQNFLYSIGNRQHPSHLSRAELYSPWGVLADTGTHRTGSNGNTEKILLGIAVIIIICVLALLCFRFILS